MAINLGFTPQELDYANRIYNESGGWLPKLAHEIMGNNFDSMQEIVKYCIKLRDDEYFQEAIKDVTNNHVFYEIPHESLDVLKKHYVKMKKSFNRGGKFFINDDFSSLMIKESASLVECRDLEPPYDIYNGGRFIDGSDRYKLFKKGTKESTIITQRHPYAETEEDLKSEQAKIEKMDDTNYLVKIKNEYVGILNRFAICVSTKPPAFHCGCFCILNSAGNIIYVYAVEFAGDLKFDKKIENNLGRWNNGLIVMAIGYKKKELEPLLMKACEYLKKYVDPRVVVLVRPEHVFEEKTNWLVEKEEETEFNY